MKSIGKFLIIKDAPPKVSKTSGGLEFTDRHEDIRYVEAEVVSVGEQVQGVKCCDMILYDKISGHNTIIEEKVYKVIQERDVIAVL